MTDDPPFFSTLDHETRQHFRQNMRPLRCPAGALIFSQGDPDDGLYVMLDGRVRLSVPIDENDRRDLVHVEAGEVFGELSTLDKRSRTATAEAATDCRLGVISHDDLMPVLQRSPQFTAWLLRTVCDRQRSFTAHYVEETLQAERLKMLGTLVRSIVHDFKTPLSTINLAAEMAAKTDLPSPRRALLCDQIGRQVQRLNGMTNELLEFSRTSSVGQGLIPLDYAGFIDPLLDEMTSELAVRGIDLVTEPPTTPPPGPVLISPPRLSQVFYNLLDNAADALSGDGRITVRWRLRGLALHTEVEDSGPGIDERLTESLFEPFVTLNKAGGTGLGLSICARIIKDHGGTIEAHRAAAGGALFRFTLPLHEARHADNPPP